MATTPAAEETVQIKLPISRGERADVFVGVNGRTWLIKRGEFVTVPKCVASVLARRDKMLDIALQYEDEAASRLDEMG